MRTQSTVFEHLGGITSTKWMLYTSSVVKKKSKQKLPTNKSGTALSDRNLHDCKQCETGSEVPAFLHPCFLSIVK